VGEQTINRLSSLHQQTRTRSEFRISRDGMLLFLEYPGGRQMVIRQNRWAEILVVGVLVVILDGNRIRRKE